MFSHKGKITPADMFEDGRRPGEFGFDPLGFGKNPEQLAYNQVLALLRCVLESAVRLRLPLAVLFGTAVFFPAPLSQ